MIRLFKKQKHNFVPAAINTAYTIPDLNGSQIRGTNFDCFYGFESPRNRKKRKTSVHNNAKM